MMNTTMNSQQRKTVHTDMNSMMISLQLHNLILRPNFESEATSHRQNRLNPAYYRPQLALKRWRSFMQSTFDWEVEHEPT